MIIETLNKWIAAPGESVLKPRAFWVFERLVYAWFFVNGLAYLGSRQIFWGAESVFMIPNYSQGLINNLFYALIYNRGIDDWVYFLHVGGALLALIGIGRAIAKVVVWITALMLYYAAWSLFNSGFLLVCLFSFYLIFARPATQKPYMIVLSNVAMIACMLQLLLVYAESAAYKMSGSMWWEGTAFYYAINLEQFSNESTRAFFNEHKWLMTMLTYLGLGYQVAFPLLVWIRKIKWVWLALGVAFHGFIAFWMGLPDFGMAMVLAYTLFIDETVWQQLFLHIGWEQRFQKLKA